MSNITTDTINIGAICSRLKAAYDEIITQKGQLNQLSLQCTGPSQGGVLEGVTAEKYQQMHEKLIKVADSTEQLMEAVIACIGNYLTGMEGYDEEFSNSISKKLGLASDQPAS